MKNFLLKNKFLLLLSAFILFVSCDNREIIQVSTQAAPVLADMTSKSVFLDRSFPNNPALTLTWTAAQYTEPVSINYKVEASATNTFAKSVLVGIVDNSQTTTTFTASQLNTAAGSLGLAADVQATMFLRLTSYLGSGDLPLTSNVTSFKITPYKLVYPTFYLVGAASYVGWDSGNAQLLYKKDNYSYIYTYMSGGENFRFLGQQAWGPTNYSIDASGTDTANKYFKEVSSNIIFGDHENMKFNGTTGIYKLTIDATSGVQKLTADASPIFDYQAVSSLYIAGTVAGNGWNAGSAIPMISTGNGIFTYTGVLNADAEFKLLGQKSWGNLEWGNILKDNNGNSGFLGPKGDNGNIKFTGDGTSTYKITVNIKGGVYSIVKQ